jgi:hypothetical protein
MLIKYAIAGEQTFENMHQTNTFFTCVCRFVNVGRVVLEVLKVFPDVDFVIQRILRTGLFSMHTANLAINTIESK